MVDPAEKTGPETASKRCLYATKKSREPLENTEAQPFDKGEAHSSVPCGSTISNPDEIRIFRFTDCL
jgi:hypothetical protein